jgi:hypothetical protein
MAAAVVVTLDADLIAYEAAHYPRLGVDGETVDAYHEVLLTTPGGGWPFPPLTVARRATGGERVILDGLHRFRAGCLAGRKSFPCVEESLPESRWFARAVELNLANGLPLRHEDRLMVAARLEKDGWTRDKVASFLRVRAGTLAKVRAVAADLAPVTARETASGPGGVRDPRGKYRPRATASEPGDALGPNTQVRCRLVLERALAVVRGGELDVADPTIARLCRELSEALNNVAVVSNRGG